MGLFRWVRWRNRMGTGTPFPRRSRKWRCRSRGISSQSSALSHQLSAVSSQPSGKTWAAARRPFLCKGLPEIVFSVKLRHLHRNPEKRRLALKPENGSEVATRTACNGRLGYWRSNQNGRLETVNKRLAGQPEEYSCAQVSAQNRGANLDWIRAKARFELSMLLVRTKTAGQKGAFAHDDYRM